MKYRRRPSKKHYEPREKRLYRRAGADSPLRLYGQRDDAIDISSLFEVRRLASGKKEGLFDRLRRHAGNASRIRKRVLAALSRGVKRAAAAVVALFLWVRIRLASFIKKKRENRREPRDMYILAGALTAVVAVAALSSFAVLYKLLLSDFFRSYESVVVPDMVGMSYAEARDDIDERFFDIEVLYEFDTRVPEGSVISQKPDGGAQRKVFRRGEPCLLWVVVSRGKEFLKVPDFVGMSARDASLELKNAAFSVAVIEEDSPSVPSGTVISTSPCGGEMLEAGGLVVLYVSRGRDRTMLLVPDVCGLTEASALAKIRAAGFSIGKVEYKSSAETAGVVISQDRIARTKSEAGGKISVTVSAGPTYLYKNVPSLYGFTVEEARKKLAEYGLVVGNVYAAKSNEPSGTVIAQSPSAGEVISPDIVSVDMYVSE